MDETPIKAGRAGPGKMKGGYFWPVYGERDEICFAYHEGVVANTLRRPWGPTHRPRGGAAHRRLRGLRTLRTKMRAHARAMLGALEKKFFEAQSIEPERATQALEMIGQLYAVEQHIREAQLIGGTLRIPARPGQADGRPVLRLGRRPIRIPRSAAELTADHRPGLRA